MQTNSYQKETVSVCQQISHKEVPVLYIVVPCYNEEEVLPQTEDKLTRKLETMTGSGLISSESRIVFVDDGSKDHTWQLITKMYQANRWVQGIKSSRNRGHQNALMEGLMTVKNYCDITISMDADLQDDINVLEQFISRYHEGCEIVYGVRSNRECDTAFKRWSAQTYYKFLSWMGVQIVYNHADYRLMSRRVLDELENYQEVNLFLRGLIPMLGFQSGIVYYERKERLAGESKYPFRKMLAFAFEGITSLSIAPIRLITRLGFFLFLISVILMIYYTVGYFNGGTIHGWATIVISIWGIGGLELLAIGVVGEYIGKIYLETKKRPRYIVEEYLRK